ncbi:3D domain-containing protein [Anaerostipes sp. PC18]|uniref:3D domain-containing protein n=1 Tax=Anaerostipes sp. PC18 TaxID=3036926 RepID=UPI00308938AA|nr:3D domain-containing protein [Anaerostipes sp. PC18]
MKKNIFILSLALILMLPINVDATEIVVGSDGIYPFKIMDGIHRKEVTKKKSQRQVKPKKKNVIAMGDFLITAYCGCYACSEGYGKKTSCGGSCKEGRTIAVDPDVIPYGSKVKIDGLAGTYIAEDTGGMINGDHIDVYFEEHVDDFKLYRKVWIIRE